ncbi:MAG: iron-siderophore ABC transporter substrate-binding protein [Cyanobacteria bacterium P01_A01_bin.17]
MKRLYFQRYLKLTIGAVFAIPLVSLANAACQVNPNEISVGPAPTDSANQADCRTIQHEAGETEICGQPQRIVVLGPFVLEPLLALGIQPSAYAAHTDWHQGDYDNPSQQIPYLGEYVTHPLMNVGSAPQPSIEVLLQMQPDLILGTNFNNADEYEMLAQIAPTVLLQWDDAETNVRTIAQAVSSPEKAEQVLSARAQQVADAQSRFAAFVADYPNILLFSTNSELQHFSMGNSAHGLCSSLLIDLGFNLVSIPGLRDNQPGAAVPISLETLTQADDTDAIIVIGVREDQPSEKEEHRDHQLTELKRAWEENAIAQSLDASKAGRVYFIPAYMCLGLPGPIGTELYLEELKATLLPPN